MDYDIKAEVDRLFDEAPDKFERDRENPVTGARLLSDLDPIAPQKQAAARALRAGKLFARDNPNLPPLPLNYSDRESMKRGGASHIVAWYARSLRACDYDYEVHPSFYDYACGVMASPLAPNFIKEYQELLAQYVPRELQGLEPGLIFRPGRSRWR